MHGSENRAGKQGGLQRIAVIDDMVRDELVHRRESEHGNHRENQPSEERLYIVGERYLIGYQDIQDIGINDGPGEEKQNHERGEHQDNHVETHTLQEIPGFVHLPDIVEHRFHAHHHPDYEPREQYRTDKPHRTGLRRIYDVFRESEQCVNRLLVSDMRSQYPLQCPFQPQASGNEERYRNERHRRHRTEKAQCHCLESYFLCRECLDGDNQHLEILDQMRTHPRKVLVIHVPDSFGQEHFPILYSLLDSHQPNVLFCPQIISCHRKDPVQCFRPHLPRAEHLPAALT